MGKRSSFDRVPRDLYETWDPKAVAPLLPFLAPRTRFAEPCVGNGALVRQLEQHGHVCYWGSDIEGRSAPVEISGVQVTKGYTVADARALTTPLKQADCIITNPPFDKKVLFPMIDHFTKQNRTWLLLSADFMHNKGSAPFMKRCNMVVSIGRIRWIPDTKMSGKENYCWFEFFQDPVEYTRFVGR